MITSATQELIGRSVDVGSGHRTVEEALRYVAEKQEMIHEAIYTLSDSIWGLANLIVVTPARSSPVLEAKHRWLPR